MLSRSVVLKLQCASESARSFETLRGLGLTPEFLIQYVWGGADLQF